MDVGIPWMAGQRVEQCRQRWRAIVSHLTIEPFSGGQYNVGQENAAFCKIRKSGIHDIESSFLNSTSNICPITKQPYPSSFMPYLTLEY
jgi:hypothetical protein